jgi:hypothetical protein
MAPQGGTARASDARRPRVDASADCRSVLKIALGPNKSSLGVEMAKVAKRREWTKDDVRELKTLARQKTPVRKIAKALKRTHSATQPALHSRKRSRLAYPIRGRRLEASPWLKGGCDL